MKPRYLFIIGLIIISSNLQAQISFTQTSNTFGNLTNSSGFDMDAGDIDGDNDIDIIIHNSDGVSSVTEIYLNDGSGNYSLLSSTGLPSYQFMRVAFIDMEGDNDLDVLVTGIDFSLGFSPKAELYQNDGAGNFTLVAGTPFVGVYLGEIEVADIDADNDADIFIKGSVVDDADKNVIYINDGTGTFTRYSNLNGSDTEGDVSFGDIDGDNDLDIIESSHSGGTQAYINTGGGFSTSSSSITIPTAHLYVRNALLDIDGDNDLDLIIAGDNTYLFTNDGTGNFTLVSGTSFTKTSNTDKPTLATGDFDGDNDEDIYLATGTTGGFYFSGGNGHFYFDNSTNLSFDNRQGQAIAVNMAGDSKVDLLIAGTNSSSNNSIKSHTNITPSTAKALTLDGTNYYTAPHQAALNAMPITVEFKIKLPPSTTTGGIIVKGSDPLGASSLRLTLEAGGGISFYYLVGAHFYLMSSTSVNDGNWHHIAITLDNSGGAVYMDGVLNNTGTWHVTPGAISNTDNLVIGEFNGAILNGAIDEIRIWNTVRTVTEIVNNMCSEIATPGNDANLVAYYKMNDHFDNIYFVDNSGNANTLTINSSTLATEAEQVGCTPPVLPVELTAFNGRLVENEVHLNWTTASEQSNEGFDVELGITNYELGTSLTTDGVIIEWKTIGFVQGNGTTTDVSNYEFIDRQPNTGTNYYRLKQIDLPTGQAGYDGNFEYSDILNIEYRTRNIEYRIYPNPANDILTIEINEPTTFQIINAQGQVALERTLEHTKRIDISHLPAGIYWVNILNNKTATSQSLVIK